MDIFRSIYSQNFVLAALPANGNHLRNTTAIKDSNFFDVNRGYYFELTHTRMHPGYFLESMLLLHSPLRVRYTTARV